MAGTFRRPSTRVSLLATAGGLILLYLAVRFLLPFVVSLVVGGALYYLFAPLVDALERRGVRRGASTVVVIVVVLAGLVGASLTLVPRAYSELTDLAQDLPEYGDRAERWLRDSRFGGNDRVDEAVDRLVERADEAGVDAVNAALGALLGAVESFFALLFGLVIGFYLLLAGPRVAAELPRWFPPGHRERWVRFGRDASAVLSGYLRARLLASLFIGTAYGTAFALIGIPDAFLLGALGGVLNLVPIVGPLIAAVPALLVAAFQGWTEVIAVLAVMVIAQQIESSLIDPHLEGRYVKLHPTVVVLVVAAGSAIAGVAGLLLAVPIAGLVRAALEAFYLESWDETAAARSRRFSDGAPAEHDPPHERPESRRR